MSLKPALINALYSHSSNINITLMVFRFYPSKDLTGNGGAPSVRKNATFGPLKQEEYHKPYHGR